MAYMKTIACLAVSRKTSGRCVAGKEWPGYPGHWIRPVSKRDTREIADRERMYPDGQFAQPLDIVAIPCAAPAPLAHQMENHRLGPGAWIKQGALAWDDLPGLVDSPAELWGAGHSSHVGRNNRVPVDEAPGASLYLVQVERIVFNLCSKYSARAGAKRAVLGRFSFNGNEYCLDVTDPYIEDRLYDKPDGEYPLNNPLLCVSLGDPWEGYYYKLIATVLYKRRFL